MSSLFICFPCLVPFPLWLYFYNCRFVGFQVHISVMISCQFANNRLEIRREPSKRIARNNKIEKLTKLTLIHITIKIDTYQHLTPTGRILPCKKSWLIIQFQTYIPNANNESILQEKSVEIRIQSRNFSIQKLREDVIRHTNPGHFLKKIRTFSKHYRITIF